MESVHCENRQILLSAAITMLFFAILFIQPKYSPAEANDLQEVITLASESSEAKATLAKSLKENPNPSRSDLKEIRNRINEILVTEKSRAVTGDYSLQTPTALAESKKMSSATEAAELESKTWNQMTTEEKITFAFRMLMKAVAILLIFSFVSYKIASN